LNVPYLDPSPENRINRGKRFGALSASMGVGKYLLVPKLRKIKKV